MTMQYDVKSAHASGSGQMVAYRTRLKNLIYQGNGTAGSIDLYDTNTAPITTSTYARSGSTVTVTSTAHGLTTGQYIGITYGVASGSSAVAGNYPITVTGANTFTITDVGSGTIAGGTACAYTTGKWLTSYNTGTAVQPFQVIFSGEGIIAINGIWVVTSNITYQTIQYG
jgi:hypothetical protein